MMNKQQQLKKKNNDLIDTINLPDGIELNQQFTSTLIEGNSPMIKQIKTTKSKAIGGKRQIKNVPQQLGRKS